ncbi:hypothetical protein JCM21900_006872 [Sporobolomyces salmonicolor]
MNNALGSLLTPPSSSPESVTSASDEAAAHVARFRPLASSLCSSSDVDDLVLPDAKRPRSSASSRRHLALSSSIAVIPPTPVVHPAPASNPSFEKSLADLERSTASTPQFEHCPIPVLTPEHGQQHSYSQPSIASVPAATSTGRTFVKRDDLTAKAVAKAAALTAAQAQAPGPVQAPEALQGEKDRFVNGLVGASVLAIESIWNSSSSPSSSPAASSSSSVLPLHYFVREVLRRSRTSCSTLQLALYYLHNSRREIREAVQKAENSRGEFAKLERELAGERERRCAGLPAMGPDAYPSPPKSPDAGYDGASSSSSAASIGERFTHLLSTQTSPLLCGRRMFLASLICASKYLQDRNYSNRAWAKISGLAVEEINANERAFLSLSRWNLHLKADDFKRWTDRLATLTTPSSPTISPVSPARHGLARSSSEYVLPASSSLSTSNLARSAPSSAVLAPSKLALTRGRSAGAVLDPSSASRARGFPIAQPRPLVESPEQCRETSAAYSSSSSASSSSSTEAADNAPVMKRKVRALPSRLRGAAAAASGFVPSGWAAGAGGAPMVVGRGGELIRAH